jgi:hypothetical protein
MTLRTAGTTLVAISSLLFVATACGTDNSSAYCDKIELMSDSVDLDTADLTNTSQMAEFAQEFGDVVEVAPDDTKGDWKELSNFFERLADGESLTDLSEDDAANVESALTNITVDVSDACDLEV